MSTSEKRKEPSLSVFVLWLTFVPWLVSVTAASAMVAPVVSFTTPDRRAVDWAFAVKAPAEIRTESRKANRKVRQRWTGLIKFPFGRDELNESKGVARMQEEPWRSV